MIQLLNYVYVSALFVWLNLLNDHKKDIGFEIFVPALSLTLLVVSVTGILYNISHTYI